MRGLPGQAGPWMLHDRAMSGPRGPDMASGANVRFLRADGRRLGCIAQLVEQLTLNQRVAGSSPATPTMTNFLPWQRKFNHP